MKVFYSRVSTSEQNDERQLQNLKVYDYILSDKCSGLIPLYERPKGSQILKLIREGKLEHLEIHSIDRLGRNMIDILGVWSDLTQRVSPSFVETLQSVTLQKMVRLISSLN